MGKKTYFYKKKNYYYLLNSILIAVQITFNCFIFTSLRLVQGMHSASW